MKSQADSWIAYIEAWKAPRTAQTYSQHLYQFLRWLGDRDITHATIEDYITATRKVCAPATVNKTLAAIKSFCSWAAVRCDTPNPALNVRGVKRSVVQRFQERKRRILTTNEFQACCAISRGNHLDTLLILGHTGIRASEFLSLTPDCDRGSMLHITGKGDKDRTIPINSRLRLALDRQRYGSYYTCVDLYSTHSKLSWLCQSIANRARIPKFTPHSLRHYFCTQLLRKGTPIETVRLIMGHASAEITLSIYTHFTEQDLQGATDCLD